MSQSFMQIIEDTLTIQLIAFKCYFIVLIFILTITVAITVK